MTIVRSTTCLVCLCVAALLNRARTEVDFNPDIRFQGRDFRSTDLARRVVKEILT